MARAGLRVGDTPDFPFRLFPYQFNFSQQMVDMGMRLAESKAHLVRIKFTAEHHRHEVGHRTGSNAARLQDEFAALGMMRKARPEKYAERYNIGFAHPH